MRCDGCASWLTCRKTVYRDGSEVVNWKADDGVGRCLKLGIDTGPDFGCAKFEAGTTHEQIDKKFGAPWQHWVMGECPQCHGDPGNHGGTRCRCAGTGLVRYYDDGHIGEEQTRLHPIEKEMLEKKKAQGIAVVTAPTCWDCKQPLESHWVACPYCGFKIGATLTRPDQLGMGNSGVVGQM